MSACVNQTAGTEGLETVPYCSAHVRLAMQNAKQSERVWAWDWELTSPRVRAIVVALTELSDW